MPSTPIAALELSRARKAQEFSGRAHSEYENKQSIFKGSEKKNVDELKGGWFFKKPPYPDLALSRILLKAGEGEHVLGNLDCGSLLAFSWSRVYPKVVFSFYYFTNLKISKEAQLDALFTQPPAFKYHLLRHSHLTFLLRHPHPHLSTFLHFNLVSMFSLFFSLSLFLSASLSFFLQLLLNLQVPT